MPYTAYEPAPKSTKYHHGGIGGIGNYRKKTTTSFSFSSPPASLPSSTAGLSSIPASSSTFRPFHGGRGGAGNAHAASERAIFSFDEELLKERRVPVYSIGRGGCGNIVNEEEEDEDEDEEDDVFENSMANQYFQRMRRMSTKSTTSSRSTQSTSSTQSNADRFIQKIKDLTKH